MAGLAGGAEQPSADIPAPHIVRVGEASGPQSAPVVARIGFFSGEGALGRVFGTAVALHRPAFAHGPLVERRGFALDRAHADPPLLERRIRPLVVAAHSATLDERVQAIA